MKRHLPTILMASALALAGTAGFLATEALSAGGAGPGSTTTISVATGESGPTGLQGVPGERGPTGPQGPPGGAETCPQGYSHGYLRINHPSGHVTIWTCIQDE